MFNYCWNSPPVSPSFKGEVLAPYFTMPPCTLASEKNFPGVVATLTSVGVGRRWELMLERSARSAVRATARRGKRNFRGLGLGTGPPLTWQQNRYESGTGEEGRGGLVGKKSVFVQRTTEKVCEKILGSGLLNYTWLISLPRYHFCSTRSGDRYFLTLPVFAGGRGACVGWMTRPCRRREGKERAGGGLLPALAVGFPPRLGFPRLLTLG